jgi:hypothetical protein
MKFTGRNKWHVSLVLKHSLNLEGGLYISTFFWFLVKLIITKIEKIDSSKVAIANAVSFLVGVNMCLIWKKSQIFEKGWNFAYMDMYFLSTEKGNTLADIPSVIICSLSA